MSGEHVFSNSIFTPGCGCPLVIEGVHRIREGKPTKGAEKSNVLCGHHNSILSPLDEAIGKLAAFQAAANDEKFQMDMYMEGELLERWLLKTVINIAAAGWLGESKLRPSPAIVEAIFGESSIPVGIGLHSVTGRDPNHRPSGGVSFFPVMLRSQAGRHLGGAYVSVHGMPLFFSLHHGLAQRLELGGDPSLANRFSEAGLRHIYRPGALVMERQRGEPVYVGLSWGGLLRFSDGTTSTFPRPKGEPLPPGIF